jgi:methyltransferase family protein
VKVLSHYIQWLLGLAEAETQTTEDERAAIARYCHDKYSLVEIGVWHGVTTKIMRSQMSEDGVLFAIDPFPRGRLGVSFQQSIAHHEVGKIRRGTIKWIRAVGPEAVRRASEEGMSSVDFIFIDGDHSFEGLRQDWELWAPLVNRDGIVALHDSCSTPIRDIESAGSVIFTRANILQDQRFNLVDRTDSLTVMKRS